MRALSLFCVLSLAVSHIEPCYSLNLWRINPLPFFIHEKNGSLMAMVVKVILAIRTNDPSILLAKIMKSFPFSYPQFKESAENKVFRQWVKAEALQCRESIVFIFDFQYLCARDRKKTGGVTQLLLNPISLKIAFILWFRPWELVTCLLKNWIRVL